MAGADIIIASLRAANTVGINGREFRVTFSDGGQQTFIYVTANPRASHPKVPSDLKLGDGVSKCP